MSKRNVLHDSPQGRGILYARCSTDQQTESLKSQVEWAMRKAAQLGVSLDVSLKTLAEAERHRLSNAGDLYIDDAITGGNMRRPGLRAFIQRAADPAVTHVFYWHRDRLGRPEISSEASQIEYKLLAEGKTVVTERRICTPDERHELGYQLGSTADFWEAGEYRKKLSKNVLRGQARRTAGTLAGRKRSLRICPCSVPFLGLSHGAFGGWKEGEGRRIKGDRVAG